MMLRTILLFFLISTAAITTGATTATILKPQVLLETSTNAPAIVFGPKETLLIAWTGTGNLQLNFQRRIGSNWQAKVTTGETSPYAPALTFYNGRYYVAWIDVGLQVKVMSSADGVNWSGKAGVVFKSSFLKSRLSPSLAVFAGRIHLVFAVDRIPNEIVHFSSVDGRYWHSTPPGGSERYGLTTSSGPALAVTSEHLLLASRTVYEDWIYVSRYDGIVYPYAVKAGDRTTERPALAVRGSNEVILAWQGLRGRQLNTMVSTNDGLSFGGRVMSIETSIGGPALAATGGRAVIAWTGTDRAHHLNVAWLGP